MKKIFTILALSLLSLGALQAQTKQYYTVGWNINVPLGDFGNFISATSLRGGFFNAQVFLNDNVAVGGNVSWNGYYEKIDRQTYHIEPNTDITANAYHYVYSTPITINGFYHFMPHGIIQPYAGLGIGTHYMNQHIIVQDTEVWDEQWGFLISPGIGAFIPLGDAPVAINLSLNYNFSTNSFSSFTQDFDNFQALTVGVGFSWLIQ